MNISGFSKTSSYMHLSFDSQNSNINKSKSANSNSTNSNSVELNATDKSNNKNSLVNALMEQKDQLKKTIDKLKQGDSKNPSSKNYNTDQIKDLEKQLEDLNNQIAQEKMNEKAKEQKDSNPDKDKSVGESLISLSSSLESVKAESSAKRTLEGEGAELSETAPKSIINGTYSSADRSDKLSKINSKLSSLESKISSDLGNISNDADSINSKDPEKIDKVDNQKNNENSKDTDSVEGLFQTKDSNKIDTQTKENSTEKIVDAVEENINDPNSIQKKKDNNIAPIGSYIDDRA